MHFHAQYMRTHVDVDELRSVEALGLRLARHRELLFGHVLLGCVRGTCDADARPHLLVVGAECVLDFKWRCETNKFTPTSRYTRNTTRTHINFQCFDGYVNRMFCRVSVIEEDWEW